MQKVVVVALAALVIFAGCSSKKTYSANGTTVTTDNSQKTVTVQNSEGTMKMGKDVVDVASLGVPVYAGAKQDEGAISVSGKNGSGQMVSFTTNDSFDNVYNFYKSKLPAGSQKMKLDEGDSSVAEFVVGDDKPGAAQTMVMITKKGDSTSIVITKGTNSK